MKGGRRAKWAGGKNQDFGGGVGYGGTPKIGSRGTRHSWLPFSWLAMRVGPGVGKGIWGEAQTVCRDQVCVRGKCCEPLRALA